MPLWAIQSLFILLLLGGMGGAGYWYYTNSQEKIEELQKANIVLVTANEENIKSLNQVQSAFNSEMEHSSILAKRLKTAEAYQDTLLKKLQRHDLTKLATVKPGLVETRINDATKQIFDDLESITSEPTSN